MPCLQFLVQIMAAPVGLPLEGEQQPVPILLLLRLRRSTHHLPEQLCVRLSLPYEAHVNNVCTFLAVASLWLCGCR